MKTPLQELKETLWTKPKELSKREVLIMIDKLMDFEKEIITKAANHGHNKYINEQIKNEYQSNNKTFGQHYYNDLYNSK